MNEAEIRLKCLELAVASASSMNRYKVALAEEYFDYVERTTPEAGSNASVEIPRAFSDTEMRHFKNDEIERIWLDNAASQAESKFEQKTND